MVMLMANKLKIQYLSGIKCCIMFNVVLEKKFLSLKPVIGIKNSVLTAEADCKMLCPEVWNFAPPHFSSKTNLIVSEQDYLQAIKHQYFNHHVSLTLPGTIQVPNDLINVILEDSKYYRINKVSPDEFAKKDFVDLFVNNGQLTVISLNEFSEQNSVVLTPCGKLILSLTKSTYQNLGIEGTFLKPSKGSLKKYLIVVELNSDSNESEKKCQEAQRKLAIYRNIYFDIVLAWEPKKSDVCPSSIAYYFSKKGYFVKTCSILYKHEIKYNVAVPVYEADSDVPDMTEWLGVFGLNCTMPNDDYISSMKCPEKNVMLGQVLQLSFTGLITYNRLKRIISEINKYINVKTPAMWISLTVQGFQNSILSIKKKHLFVSDGNHLFTIIFRWNHPSVICIFQEEN